MAFIDEVEITCVSGNGGPGAASFWREKFVPHGGPDGGDGGSGGSVILRAVERRNTLEHLRGQRFYKARPGRPGGGRNRSGARGQDAVIDVPAGTVVFDTTTNLQIADLTAVGDQIVICRGGRGGLGNTHFKTSTNRTPRYAQPGTPGEERHLRLELKLLADVGLLGFPNAGKSTFISVVSNARPRIADYPFTTLVPNLGVVRRGWEDTMVIADIPGLIEGASEGQGLGLQFLRHVERCRVLLHLISASEEDETTPSPLDRYRILRKELERFSPDLAQRPEVVALTKWDLVQEDALSALQDSFEAELGFRPRAICAPLQEGTAEALADCWEALRLTRAEEEAEAEALRREKEREQWRPLHKISPAPEAPGEE